MSSNIGAITEVDDDQVMLPLPGFRFHPTDEELVSFYLRRKIEKKLIRTDLIKQIDIYKYDPWDLAKNSSNVTEKEWYYFCKRGRKYRNSIRPNRVTASGFWKATGIDKQIYSAAGGSHGCIGLKKALVYYLGSSGKGTKTDWMMHEFRLPPHHKSTNLSDPKAADQEAEIWTLCRILKRDVSSKKKYTPDRREVSAKRSSSSARPKTHLNADLKNWQGNYISFGGAISLEEENSNKGGVGEDMDERKEWLVVGSSERDSCSSSPVMSSDEAARELFTVGNWDEIVSPIDFSFDPFYL